MLKHFGRGQSTAYYVAPQPWAGEPGTPDPAKIEELHKALTKAVESWEKDVPEPLKPENVNFFAESHISARLTAGNFPEYWNGEPFKFTDEEQKRLKMFFETSRLAAEMVRKDLPGRKVMIPWGDPGFVVPILRANFPKNLIDGSSIDVPNFERLPEMQLYDNAIHRLYELRAEYKKFGMDNPQLWFCEGIFVPTEVGACSYREQMDIYTRSSLISIAYGVQRFLLELVRLRLRELLRRRALWRLRHPAAHPVLRSQARVRVVRDDDRQAQRGELRRLREDRLADDLLPAFQARNPRAHLRAVDRPREAAGDADAGGRCG
jgi:hypothetical protein